MKNAMHYLTFKPFLKHAAYFAKKVHSYGAESIILVMIVSCNVSTIQLYSTAEMKVFYIFFVP